MIAQAYQKVGLSYIVLLALVALLQVVLVGLELADASVELLDLLLQVGRLHGRRIGLHAALQGGEEGLLRFLLLFLGHAHLLLSLHDVTELVVLVLLQRSARLVNVMKVEPLSALNNI